MWGADLRAWIERIGLSRRAAADRIGISKRTLDGYLGKSEPRPIPKTVELLCGYVEDEWTRFL